MIENVTMEKLDYYQRLRNFDLLEIGERNFATIINEFTESIDAYDPMTAGHSKKVSEYCLGICDKLEISGDYKEMIRLAALLHDYGKIGIPVAILKKPAKLNRVECKIVKTHAEKTRRMLEEISFKGVFSQIPEIAGAHHEKLDGSGYPDGLKVNEIPMGARIIAVADFFEAVTSMRNYRDPIPVNKAFEMLYEEREGRLDKKAVDAFISYYAMKHAWRLEYRALSN